MRAIWKGTISFGLVSIPVTVLSASNPNEIKFNMLDSEDSARIRYLRVNEETGEEVPWARIVKGYEYEEGKYVLMKDEDFRQIEAEGTKTIDLDAFVDRSAVEPIYYETPYYLMPAKGSEKPYILLRQALEKSDKIGIARIVIRSKQSLAAIYAYQEALILNLLRFDEEIRPVSEYEIPTEAKISAKEATLAQQLIDSMSEKWQPGQFHNEYAKQLKAWVDKKVKAGDVSSAPAPSEEEPSATKAEDILEMLLRSIKVSDEDLEKAKASGKKSVDTDSKSKTKKVKNPA